LLQLPVEFVAVIVDRVLQLCARCRVFLELRDFALEGATLLLQR
jgi:hypothetical protein